MARHGDFNQVITMCQQQFVRQAIGLAPYDQAVAVFVLGLCINPFPFSAGKPQALCGASIQEVLPVFVVARRELFPVVQACTAQLAVGDFKTQWVDEVQPTTGTDAEAAYAARVLGYFGLVQDDVEQ